MKICATSRALKISRCHEKKPDIENGVELSAQKNCAESSTRWPSAQYLRSIIQSNYQRRVKLKEWAKLAGRPWSVTTRGEASDGRALRPHRCSHERRKSARCARVKTFSGGVTGDCEGSGPLVKQTVSLRTTFSHPLRMRQRGQSFHNTGARGGGSEAFSRGGEESERWEESGQNTALTRRGLTLEWLS